MFTDRRRGYGGGRGTNAVTIMHGVYLSLDSNLDYDDFDASDEANVTTHHINQTIDQIRKARDDCQRTYEAWTCPLDAKTETNETKVIKVSKGVGSSKKRKRETDRNCDEDHAIFMQLLRKSPRPDRQRRYAVDRANLGVMVYLLDTIKRYDTLTRIRDDVYQVTKTLPSSICRIIASLSVPIPEPRIDVLHIGRWPCCLDKDGARVLGVYISYTHQGHYNERTPLATTAVDEMRQGLEQGEIYGKLLSKCLNKPAQTYSIPGDCGTCS